jgi:hypothetical protein
MFGKGQGSAFADWFTIMLMPVHPVACGARFKVTDERADCRHLLLDKPVLFLVPDLEEYTRKDRQFQFDFDEMTPGSKLKTWEGVCSALVAQWEHDEYAEERARLRRLAFDDLPQDQPVPKLIPFMRERDWI